MGVKIIVLLFFMYVFVCYPINARPFVGYGLPLSSLVYSLMTYAI